MTREEWLEKATELLRQGIFKDQGVDVPCVKVSVGFPGGKGARRKAIGQYWHASACQDNVPQVFISPVLSDSVHVLDVLTHELCHACTPGNGHGKEFGKLARALGLEGKLTATVASESLKVKLQVISDTLGKYPHSAIIFKEGDKAGITSLFKVSCSECGYAVRVTQKQLNMHGTPLCPCNGERMEQCA